MQTDGARIFRQAMITAASPYHLHHFSVQSMGLAVEKAGLAVEQVRTITMSEWLLYQWIHVCFPKTWRNSFMHWKDKADLDKIWIKAMTLVHHLKINHLITACSINSALGITAFLYLLRSS
jgi:hypothetical protein